MRLRAKIESERKKKRMVFLMDRVNNVAIRYLLFFLFLLFMIEFTISTIVVVPRVSLKVIKMNELAMVKPATWRQRA